MNTKTFSPVPVLIAASVAVAAFVLAAPFVHASAAPTVSLAVLDASNATTTSAAVGSLVHASTMVASSTGSTTPSGTINFTLFQNISCSSTGAVQSGVPLINGVAISSATTLTLSGLSYLAHYSGDINYPAADSVCQALVATTTAPVTGPGTISGTVFNDLNNNDIKDASDPGLSGWTVWLHMGVSADPYNDPIIATSTTDGNGNYSFANLVAGSYFLEEQELAGWNQTTGDTAVALNNAQTSKIVNFANVMKNASTTDQDHQQGHRGGGNHDNDKNNGDGHDNGTATSTDQGHGKGGGNDNNNGGDKGNNAGDTHGSGGNGTIDQGHGNNGTNGDKHNNDGGNNNGGSSWGGNHNGDSGNNNDNGGGWSGNHNNSRGGRNQGNH